MALTLPAIARLRLHNQWITAPIRGDAADVVDHLMAAQSQDFAGAKWSLGLRLREATEADIQRAYDDGRILRTHVLRPTWHFVTPSDIRWLLALTGPRVQQVCAGMYRRGQLEPADFRRSEAVLEKSLRGRHFLTRNELRKRLDLGGIQVAHENRLSYVLIHAELEGLICSGPRRGKQLTYALLAERAPALKKFDRESALAEFARRFFSTRGPATVQDMARWATLPLAECRTAVEAAQRHLQKQAVGKQEYWFAERAAPPLASPSAHLVSVFDEYLASYKGYDGIASEAFSARLVTAGNGLLSVILVDGQILGTWRRTFTKEAARIQLAPFGRLTAVQKQAIAVAAEKYAAFHGVRAEIA